MAYLASIHKPSSIRHALTLAFFDAKEECLVVAKSNHLEFYQWTGNGITLRHSEAVYGRVAMLEKIRPESSQTDHLLVGTDRYSYFTVSWDSQRRALKTEKECVDLTDSAARDTQTGEKCLVDPTGHVMVLELCEGVITVVPIFHKTKGRRKVEDWGNIGDPVPVRIRELFVRSMAFLHGSDTPKLALLWEDGHGDVHVSVKELSFLTPGYANPALKDTDTVAAKLEERGASHIISVPEPVRGLIVLGETSVMYFGDEQREPCTTNLAEFTMFVAWVALSDTAYLLADDYGNLHRLELKVLRGRVLDSMTVEVIGTTSRASCLLRIAEEHVFVGSHQGESQVIKLGSSPGSLEVIQTLPNIAPVLDFAVMDLGTRASDAHLNEYSSGQARIVTGSGAFQDGSLRSVRSGVGLEDQGILGEIGGIQRLFSLRSSESKEKVDTLLASLLEDTRIFHFGSDGDAEELDRFCGFTVGESTLVAAEVPSGRLVQITPSSVTLTDMESGTVVARWEPPDGQKITNASASQATILLAVGGVRLVRLSIGLELAMLEETPPRAERQIACVAVSDRIDDIGFVGAWEDGSVSVVRLDNLQAMGRVIPGEAGGASVPRGLLLAQVLVNQHPTLFVAMADGTVVTYAIDPATKSISGKKTIFLGTQEAKLQPLPRRNGLVNVFAACEHPNLIYGFEGRLVYSAVTAREAISVCDFNAEAYGGSVAVATSDELKIAEIDEERRTHVRDLHVGETVRRVAYSTELKSFVLGTIHRKAEKGVESIKSNVKLVDEVLFDLLDTYDLNNDELIESAIRAELIDSKGDVVEAFVVGTGYIDADRNEPVRGRILVFEVDEDRRLRVLTELATKGSCRCLGVVEGKLVAALIKTVVVYSLRYNSARPSLVKLTSYRTSTAPVDLAVSENLIAVADLMKSVSIVQYKAGQGGLPDTMGEVARHHNTAWATAVAHVAEDTYLESDAEGNLMVLHRNRDGVSPEDRVRLEVTSEMLLGEMVNRIRRIDVAFSGDATVIPRAFVATVEGAIYLFALISPKKQDLLMRLQSSIAEKVENSGHMSFAKFRAFKNTTREADEPWRFVDGDLIERFLDCSETLQEKIVAGLDMDVDAVRSMVEHLKRLR